MNRRARSAAVRPQPNIDAPDGSSKDDFATSLKEEHHGAFFAAAFRPRGSQSYVAGVEKFVCSQVRLYTNFGALAQSLSARIKAHAEAVAQQHGRPLHYLESAQLNKEDLARSIAERDKVREGLVCVPTCVEPCRSFFLRRNGARKEVQIVGGQRKCLHVYFYFVDREFGLMHVRLQTWLPFPMQGCPCAKR